MGIDYLTCSFCDRGFPDCNDFDCCECGAYFCLSCRREKTSLLHGFVRNNDEDDNPRCMCCTNDWNHRHIGNDAIIEFLLEQSSYSSLKEVEEAIREKGRIESNSDEEDFSDGESDSSSSDEE